MLFGGCQVCAVFVLFSSLNMTPDWISVRIHRGEMLEFVFPLFRCLQVILDDDDGESKINQDNKVQILSKTMRN